MVTRILAVAGLTIKESARKKVALGMMICTVIMTVALGLVARSIQASEGGQMELAIAVSTLLRVVASFSWVLALFISLTAVSSELERRTTYTLFSKPLERFEFVLGKYLGCCALLAVNLAIIALLITWMLWSEDRDLAMALVKNVGTFFVSYSTLIALTLSLTLFLPMAIAGLLALGIYFLASVYNYGQSVAQTESLHPLWRGLGEAVYQFGRVATPRINWLNVDRPFYDLVRPTQPEAIGWVFLYSLVVLALGSLLFARREL